MQPNPLIASIKRAGVANTPEFKRIRDLPKRPAEGHQYVAEMTALLRTPGGAQTLSPQQALSLYEIPRLRGAAVILSPGSGKTHIGALAPTVCGASRPMYLCPSNARTDLFKSLTTIRQHWKTHHNIMVHGFGEIQTKTGRNLLRTRMPDCLIIDEVHQVANRDSARGNRIVEYKAEFPDTVLVIMTGSASNRDLMECAHLFAYALGEGSPIPLDSKDIMTWSAAIGSETPEYERPAPGALKAFIDLLPAEQRHGKTELDLVRMGFKERLRLTPGVIMEEVKPRERRIVIRTPKLDVPKKVKDAFEYVHAKGQVAEDEEQFADRIEEIAALKQLICGFYYRWVWPNKVKNKRWVDARKAWHKYVRGVTLGRPSRKDTLANEWATKDDRWKLPLRMDSKGIVEDACRAHEAYRHAKEAGHPLAEMLEDELRIDCPEYRAWIDVAHEYDIVTEAIWLDSYMVDYAEQWLKRNHGVVWVPYKTVGAALQERGVIYFGGGAEGGKIIDYKGPCAASFKSHHQSKNLQQWNKALYLSPPGSGQAFEQSLARLDRRGQRAEEVAYDVLLLCRPTYNAWEQALRGAEYAHMSWSEQRLIHADKSGVLTPEQLGADKKGCPLWKD